MIGVGAIGTGKSFLKNTLGSHFLKYGGILRSIDIDAGSEPIANVFCQESGIFRMDKNCTTGFNPFISARNKDDLGFIRHLKSLLIQMIQTNDQTELQTLTRDDQTYLDDAIVSLLKLPKNMQKLSTLISHTPHELALKFKRFVHARHEHEQDGLYAYLFDAEPEKDVIGSMNKNIAVFNLKNIRQDKTALPLVMKEIFYRITTLFEDQNMLNTPKQLDIDEAHHFLKIKENVQFLTESVRTWRKYRAGVSLWSQGANEFMQIPDWNVIRDATSTFIFTATPKLDENLYKTAFNITDGECKAIKSLIPQKEIYIIQPDLKISKKVQLNVDPTQYALLTSKPNEVDMRNKFIEKHGFEKGMRYTIKQLNV